MKKIILFRQMLKLEIHEKLGVFPIHHQLIILSYIYLKLIKNIYKKINQNQLKQKIKLNYLNPYFFNELIEMYNTDIKLSKKLNLL